MNDRKQTVLVVSVWLAVVSLVAITACGNHSAKQEVVASQTIQSTQVAKPNVQQVAIVSVPTITVKLENLSVAEVAELKKSCCKTLTPKSKKIAEVVKQSKPVVYNHEPTKLVTVINNTKDCKVVVSGTYREGMFKRQHAELLAGGNCGIGCLPGSKGINLKVCVYTKKGKLKYETRQTYFRFDTSVEGQEKKEKYVWTVVEKKKKSTIQRGL